MILKTFHIKNFKSIIDSGIISFEKNNILVLAGQNESGKSAILQALDYFNLGKSEKHDRLYARSDAGGAWVSCTYELTDDDINYLQAQSEDKPELTKFLTENRSITLCRGDTDEAKDDHEMHVSQETLNMLGPVFEKEPETAGEKKTWPGLTEFCNELKGESLRTYATYDDTFENLLPGEIKAAEVAQNQAVKDFEKVFEVDFLKSVEKDARAIAALENKVNKNATDDLNKYWKQKLDVGTKYNFRVKVNRNATTPAESIIDFTVESHDGDPTPLFLEQKSKGFRWFSAFNLRLRALGIVGDHPEDLLLVIDEPGEGLHERAQLDLKVVIEELATKGARVIYSTHNPLLLGTEGDELSRIRIVHNSSENGTKVSTLTQYSSLPGITAQDALSPLVTALGLRGVDKLRPEGNKLNVVVEGITDHYYYLAFSKLLGYDGAFYLPSSGADNVPNVVTILLGWQQPFKVILDDDAKGRSVAKKIKTMMFDGTDDQYVKLIYRVKGCAGVEDVLSGADFRKHVTGDNSKKSQTLTNTENAKGKKEVLARLFFDKVHKGEVELKDFDKDSKAAMKSIVEWLKKK